MVLPTRFPANRSTAELNAISYRSCHCALVAGLAAGREFVVMCDQFIGGEYQQDGAENLNEYLTAKGVPWLVRKLIDGKMNNHSFNLSKVNDEGTYKIVLGTAKGKMEYEFKFDEPITATGYDGKQHRITFSLADGKLMEKHEHLEGDRKGESNDVTEWKFDNGKLLAETAAIDKNGTTITWKKFFKKLN